MLRDLNPGCGGRASALRAIAGRVARSYDRAVTMKPLRTPEADTEGLPGYPFAANYLNVGDADEGPARIHFVDHRPRSGLVTLFADGDPIMVGAEKILQARIPGAAGQPHKIIRDAGHFIQEDAGEELADELIKWLL
jgi:pimeloyl-ACP methyl ester carboxylesterase